MKSMSFYFLVALVFFFGCSRSEQAQPSVIVVNGISFSQEDFEAAYQRSRFSAVQTPQARKDFLDQYVTTKLILLAAEQEGLNKDPQFLRDVEAFWHQSLLKLMIDKKIQELMQGQAVSPQEKKKYYADMQEKYFRDKPYDDVQETIEVILLREKQQKAMEDWLRQLKQSADIRIDKELLLVK